MADITILDLPICPTCKRKFEPVRKNQVHCTDPKCQMEYDRQRAQRKRELTAAEKVKQAKENARYCSNCGALMGTGHIKFGRDCRAAAGAPGYVTVRQEYRLMEVCSG